MILRRICASGVWISTMMPSVFEGFLHSAESVRPSKAPKLKLKVVSKKPFRQAFRLPEVLRFIEVRASRLRGGIDRRRSTACNRPRSTPNSATEGRPAAA